MEESEDSKPEITEEKKEETEIKEEPKPEVKQEIKKKPIKIEKIKKPGLFSRLKNKYSQYKRVLSVARKPDKEEFIKSTKITGAGIILIGVLGFIIFLIYVLVVP